MMDLPKETTSLKKKVRPAQRLYVPPAQRNKKKGSVNNNKCEDAITESGVSSKCQQKTEEVILFSQNDVNNIESDKDCSLLTSNCASCNLSQENINIQNIECTKNDETSLVIMLDDLKVKVDKTEVDVEQEEMERAIVNINRKSRPLIKHVNVGNSDVLHIDVDDDILINNKPARECKKLVSEQITDWEDLFSEEECEFMEQIVDYIDDNKSEELSEDDICSKRNAGMHDLEHVVELYDFPPTFKTQDLMQLYHDVNEESMYVKWCDETHALLVLSTPAQAKKALQITHDIIKSRSMLEASLIATQVSLRCDLKPAMKRPQTNMQTARRLITSHLGTRSRISREEQQRERDELRKAKELKRALRQSENDAWDGHPRPSTA